jgi:hypothetical protein
MARRSRDYPSVGGKIFFIICVVIFLHLCLIGCSLRFTCRGWIFLTPLVCYSCLSKYYHEDTYEHKYIYINIYTCVYVNKCILAYTQLYGCMYLYEYIYIYIYIYIHIYIYMYIFCENI